VTARATHGPGAKGRRRGVAAPLHAPTRYEHRFVHRVVCVPRRSVPHRSGEPRGNVQGSPCDRLVTSSDERAYPPASDGRSRTAADTSVSLTSRGSPVRARDRPSAGSSVLLGFRVSWAPRWTRTIGVVEAIWKRTSRVGVVVGSQGRRSEMRKRRRPGRRVRCAGGYRGGGRRGGGLFPLFSLAPVIKGCPHGADVIVSDTHRPSA
jgi:hypothetical protein